MRSPNSNVLNNDTLYLSYNNYKLAADVAADVYCVRAESMFIYHIFSSMSVGPTYTVARLANLSLACFWQRLSIALLTFLATDFCAFLVRLE